TLPGPREWSALSRRRSGGRLARRVVAFRIHALLVGPVIAALSREGGGLTRIDAEGSSAEKSTAGAYGRARSWMARHGADRRPQTGADNGSNGRAGGGPLH